MLDNYREVPNGQSEGYYLLVISFYNTNEFRDIDVNKRKLAKCYFELGLIYKNEEKTLKAS